MKYLVFIFLLCIVWECNKIELPLIVENPKPIFEMNTEVAGSPLKLSAGVNNVILYTDFNTSSFEVLTLQGVFRDQGCSVNCKKSLALKLRYRLREFVKDTAKSIVPGRMTFFKGTPDSVLMKAKNNSMLSSSGTAKYSYLWTIDDKKFSDRELINFNLKPNSKYKVCLMINHPDGSNASQCQTVDFSSVDSFQGLKVSIIPQQLANKNWNLRAQIDGGLEPIKYAWENKSNVPSTSSGASAELEIKSASNQCLTIYDSRGNSASTCIDLQPEAKVKSRADFDLNTDPVMLKEFMQFNTVELIYTDENGQIWTTATANQKPNYFFEIIQVKPYQSNDMKQPTRKLEISFSADFFNAARSSISIKGNGTIAVAYPIK
ncbi:MAG: hypothetical protein ABI761_06270 [Saprospiraceae bacterium]